MTSSTSTTPLAPADCRFLFGSAEADRAFHESLAKDVRAAYLSPVFRAYYMLRSLIPLRMRQLLQRIRPVVSSRRWCFPDDFVDALVGQLGVIDEGLTTIHPWPDGARFAFVLTHDVETAVGLRNVARIAGLEEQLGFRSSWNIVPHKYPVDRGLLAELQSRGFEIGVHGYNHDGKLFTSRAMFDQRVPAINAALQSFGAVGFRAPMVHRNLNWLQDLDIEYDASCFDVDPYQAMPGGVGGLWPFIAGRFVELPYTLPQDHTLFVALHQSDISVWRQKLDYIARQCGMSLVITHPDYLDSARRIDLYRDFLVRARDLDGIWHALPKDVSAWWRVRDLSTLKRESSGNWTIIGLGSSRARGATIHVNGTATERAGPSPGRAEPLISWSELSGTNIARETALAY